MTRREWVAILLAVFVAGLWMHPLRAQQASRYALTAALVDHGTVVLDDYKHTLGVDRAVRDGRTYSDKAPGQPLLATPFYAAYRAAGGKPGEVLKIERNWGLWWVTLWSAAVPLGVLSVLMSRYLTRRGRADVAWPVSLAISYGTLLFPFGALLFGHVAAALALFSMWYLVDTHPSRARVFLAGIVGGAAVVIEYTAIIGVSAIAAWSLWRFRARVWPLLAGGALPAVGLAAYNLAAFASPFSLSYRFLAFEELTAENPSLQPDLSNSVLDNVIALATDPRGLVLATPIVVVGIVGLATMWRGETHRAALSGTVVLGLLAVVIAWDNPWGGDSPGARYLVPALPFLALPVAALWRRRLLLAVGGTAIGVVTMLMAVATDPLVSRQEVSGLGTWVRLAIRGDTAPTVMNWAPWDAVFIALVSSAIAVVVLRQSVWVTPVFRHEREGDAGR